MGSRDKLVIVVPLAGEGRLFQEAGFAFPKPLIDIGGRTMIEVVINNLRPDCPHRFVFICRREHYEKFDLHHILKAAAGPECAIVQINGRTAGAACTVLCATAHIDNDHDLLIANADQFIEGDINDFIRAGREGDKDGLIMTFSSRHPRWSYVRLDKDGRALETAEKTVISDDATAGLYYFRRGSDFVRSAQDMILKNISYKNEFFVCPVYNELILNDRHIRTWKIDATRMHGLGTPEELKAFQAFVAQEKVAL